MTDADPTDGCVPDPGPLPGSSSTWTACSSSPSHSSPRRPCGCSPRRGWRSRPKDFRPFIGMGEDRFLGGVAEARGVVLEMPRDKVRTYEIYLELIQGRLEAASWRRRIHRPVPFPGVEARGGIECRSDEGRRATSVSLASRRAPSTRRRRRGHRPQEAGPGYLPRSRPPAGPGTEHLSGDRGCRLGGASREGRRFTLPGDHYIVFRREARLGRSRLDGRDSGRNTSRCACLVEAVKETVFR